MSELSFIPLGTGDAFSAERYSFCLLVGAEDRWLLIDCPHPARKMLREGTRRAGLDLDLGDVDAVLLSHLHADHASGLESFGYFNFFALGRRAQLYAQSQVSERLWNGHLAAGMERLLTRADGADSADSADGADGAGIGGCVHSERGLEDYFELHSLDTDGEVRVGPFVVECRMTTHHIPTTAFRIRAGDRSLGISADTAFDPALLDWLLEADLVIHETNFGPAHTPYERLAELPEAQRARMRLIHYPDSFDLEASVIEPLEEGVRYVVHAGPRE
jgi:ribonuclease BN (tRNA processing enzyme)